LKFGKEYIKSLQLSILELLKWAEDSATSKRKNGYVTLPLYWHINLDEWEKDREKELECTVRMTRKMWFLRPSTVGEAKFTFDDFEKFTTVNFGDYTSSMALEDTPIVKRLKTPIGLFKNTNMEFIASPRTWTRQYAYGAVPEKKKRRKCSLLFCLFQKGIFAELINGVVDNSKYPREAQYLEPPRDKPTPELRREVEVVKDENEEAEKDIGIGKEGKEEKEKEKDEKEKKKEDKDGPKMRISKNFDIHIATLTEYKEKHYTLNVTDKHNETLNGWMRKLRKGDYDLTEEQKKEIR